MSCDSKIYTAQVPGPMGPAGENGTNGTDGVSAFTTVESFTMPAELSNTGSLLVGNSTWMAVNSVIFVSGGAFKGYFQVISKADSTHVVLKNLEDTGSSAYAINSPPGSVFPNGSAMEPGGVQGPQGPSVPGGTYFAIANNLSEGNPAAMRNSLALGTIATFNQGVANGQVPNIQDAGGIGANEVVVGTGLGVQGLTAAQTRTLLSLGTAALVDTGTANTKIPTVDDAGGLTNGEAVFATATGLESKNAAAARLALGIVSGYGLIGSRDNVDLDNATDTTISISATRYRIDKMTLESPSAAVTTATAGFFTAAGGGGTTLAAIQALSGSLTGTTKFMDLTPQAVVGTTVRTEATLYLNVGTPEGSARSANFRLYGWVFA